jgi:nucleotide-binding universal stress UspA family protein
MERMKVVLGADGSEHAEFAAEFLTRYPMAEESVVDCCGVYSASHVVTATSHPFLGPMLVDQLTHAVDDARDGAEAAARRLCSFIRDRGRKSEAHLLQGDPGEELANYAEEMGAAFVAVGSRGLGRFDALLLGSVGREIANNRSIDLLVARRREASGGLKALFATDHSDFAERVAAKLPSMVEGKFAELEVLSVVDPDSKDVAFARSSTPWDDLQTGLAGWAGEQNEATVAKLSGLADRCVSNVLSGHAREAIIDRAEEMGADLIIIGAQGRTALSRLLIGSVSSYVLTRAKCSVMIVRA